MIDVNFLNFIFVDLEIKYQIITDYDTKVTLSRVSVWVTIQMKEITTNDDDDDMDE